MEMTVISSPRDCHHVGTNPRATPRYPCVKSKMPLPQDNFAVLFFTRGESRPPKVRVSRGDLTGGSSWQPSGCIRIGQKEIGAQ